ncbi:hypothetical protein GGX14DRAFT_651309 [Mycena pura]|uniref:NB-ARC domain-containing protein n=1 Tax=Mycena pura TaxID=153505 RepID=A0AAD6YNW2_9AGAR|nr:hypothetical protein GGX14DRAFT_651309 [Mycena pura]
MSTNNTGVSWPKRQPQNATKSKMNWLGPVLLTVRVATASADILPFTYVKGIFATITTVLEAVEKVKKNRDVLKELCEDIAEIINIVRAKLSDDPDNGAGELEDRCKELDSILQDVLIAVQKMQKPRYFLKELFTTTVITDEISGYQDKIKKLLSNFMSASQFSDIFLVDTSSTETIDSSLRSIAIMKSIGTTAKDALLWLTSKQDKWLLLFDNADDPKINLNTWLPQCNHGNIIITSRNPELHVYAGVSTQISNMQETDAIAILLKAAKQEITSENEKMAAEIVKVSIHVEYQ